LDNEKRYTGTFNLNTAVGTTDNFNLRLDYEDRQFNDSGSFKEAVATSMYFGTIILKNKIWNYQVAAAYENYEQGSDQTSYSGTARIGSSSDFGKIHTTYSFGLNMNYDDVDSKYDTALFMGGTAGTMLTSKLALNASGDFFMNESRTYRLSLESRYLHSKNLQFFARYMYDYANDSYKPSRYGAPSRYGFQGITSGRTTHSARLGVQGRVRDMVFTSSVEYTQAINGGDNKSFEWFNTFDTVFFNAVRFSLTATLGKYEGAEFTDKDFTVSTAQRTNRISLTNMISMSPWRRVILSLESSYTKASGDFDTTHYHVHPAASYTLRRLSVSADYWYIVDKFENRELREHRLTFRLTRAFMF